jgi:hypothetical protein
MGSFYICISIPPCQVDLLQCIVFSLHVCCLFTLDWFFAVHKNLILHTPHNPISPL